MMHTHGWTRLTFVSQSARDPVFVTGRAGTGKSTLLQYFRATTAKKLAVLAPTGVAAVQVQGQTIHSFFGFGLDITVEKVQRQRVRDAALYRKLDTLVIDEISMVRASFRQPCLTFNQNEQSCHGWHSGVLTICMDATHYSFAPSRICSFYSSNTLKPCSQRHGFLSDTVR